MNITDEAIAIVAKRSEWAGLLAELGHTSRGKLLAKENPETFLAADTHADNPEKLIDCIAICSVDTQLRVEKHIPADPRIVKVLKSESLMRSAWEVRDP